MKDIVVGVDASTSAEHALDRALLEAERTGRTLRVVHAWTTPAWVGGSMMGAAITLPSPDDCRAAARSLVDELLAKAMSRRTSQAPVDVQVQVEEGDPARVLSRLSHSADLVVVGGSGHGQLTSALLGSATTYVLHHVACPVMVVPHTTDPRPFARVVVGVDGSPASRAALAWGAAAAASLSCPLVAVHAWVIHASGLPAAYGELQDVETYANDARTWLDLELAATLPAEAAAAAVRRTPCGFAAGALLDEAGPGDLLVVGSRGRGGFSSLLLGSVASQTATHARGCVVVLKAHDVTTP